MSECKKIIVGIDETGRGSCIGPIITCAVAFPNNHLDNSIKSQLKDSKVLSAKKRAFIASKLSEHVLYAFGAASAAEIDQINPLQATMLAMRRAVFKLKINNPYLLVDGNQYPFKNNQANDQLKYPGQTLVKGDSRAHQIKAASILAKEFRDFLIVKLSYQYPMYGLEHHAGYGTKKHFDAITKNGPCVHHRLTFIRKVYS